MFYDVVIIGGGPAGLAAALGAKEKGANKVLILERDVRLGGILNQCIHNGFGLHTFNEELTGPEYAARYIYRILQSDISYKLNTMVLAINANKEVTYVNPQEGVVIISAGSIVMAMGCRERARGAIGLTGYRQSGVFTAGTAQRLINLEGHQVGKKVVILGSGDIGLIMARRMTLEGAKIELVVELMPYSSGLKRNIVQCLDDFNIPLKLSHTVTEVHGRDRVTGVTIAQVDKDRKPIRETEEFYECDTLLLSCGLIPENELTKNANIEVNNITGGALVTNRYETSVPGIFSCGNALHVHDLVDYVSEEAQKAGQYAAEYVCSNVRCHKDKLATITFEGGIRYTVPQYIDINELDSNIVIRFRVGEEYKDKIVRIYFDGILKKEIRRAIMAPGQMETIIIPRDLVESSLKNLLLRVEG